MRVTVRKFSRRSGSYRVTPEASRKVDMDRIAPAAPAAIPPVDQASPPGGAGSMISRAHGLVLSLLLGAASAAGAYAVIGTAKLGDAQTKPEVVSSRQIAMRARKLDAWEASLRKALAAKPPALPALNRYAAVTFVARTGGGVAAGTGPRRPEGRAEAAAGRSSPVVARTAKTAPKHAGEDPPEHVDAVAATAPDDHSPPSS